MVYVFNTIGKGFKENTEDVSDTEDVSVLPFTLSHFVKKEETIDTIVINENNASNLVNFIFDFTLPDAGSTYSSSIFVIQKAIGTSPNNYVKIIKYTDQLTIIFFKNNTQFFSIRSRHHQYTDPLALFANSNYNSAIAELTGRLRMQFIIPRTYVENSHIDVNITHVETNITYTYNAEAPLKPVILWFVLSRYSASDNYTLDDVPYTVSMEAITIQVHELKIIT